MNPSFSSVPPLTSLPPNLSGQPSQTRNLHFGTRPDRTDGPWTNTKEPCKSTVSEGKTLGGYNFTSTTTTDHVQQTSPLLVASKPVI